MKEQRAIERISQMEEILDRASSVMAELEKNLSELESLQPISKSLKPITQAKTGRLNSGSTSRESSPKTSKEVSYQRMRSTICSKRTGNCWIWSKKTVKRKSLAVDAM